MHMMAQTIRMTRQAEYHLSATDLDAEMELVRAAQAEPQKFEPLYRTYYPRIIAFVYQRIDDKELAYDITAQVFYSALKNLGKYKAQGVPFSAWLFRIALNELNQVFRKNRVQRTINVDNHGMGNLKQAVEKDDGPETDERLFKALQCLSPDELELVDMRFFEDRSFREICEINGMNESACKMRLYRALEKLKTHFQKHF